MTPETIRAQGHLQKIELVEPMKLDQNDSLSQGWAGVIRVRPVPEYPRNGSGFSPISARFPAQVGRIAYGVRCNSDDAGNFDYVCGVKVKDFSRPPADWRRVRIPEHSYAVFSQSDHISTIRSTWNGIWSNWLPESEYRAVDAPDFERYGDDFDSVSGMGGFEIWIPINRRRNLQQEKR